MSGFFNIDSPLFRFLSKLADIFILNILFLICCIPIITIGASTTALFTVTLKLVKNEEGYIFSGFFKAFKDNFKQSTIIWLIMAFVGIALYIDSRFWFGLGSTLGTVIGTFTYSLIIIYFLIMSCIFPVLAKFDNTIRNTFKFTAFFAVKHLLTSIIVTVVSIVVLFLVYVSPMALMAMFFVGFGAMAMIDSFFFLRVFKRYYPNNPEDVIKTPEQLAQENKLNEKSSLLK